MTFDFDLYERHRTSRVLGATVSYREETVSTMDDARAGVAAGQPEGTAYVAGVQTGGRGRLGHHWVSAPSGLWVTYHLVTREASLAPIYSIAGALAVADAVRETALLTTQIKWPNDVLAAGQKLAGVLAESVVRARTDVFLGIGVNLRPVELPEDVARRATSVEEAGGIAPPREALLAALSAALERHAWQLQRSPAVVVEEWRRRLVTLGQRVRLQSLDHEVHEGQAVDVSPRGELLVRLDSGRIVSFAAGEVTSGQAPVAAPAPPAGESPALDPPSARS